MKSKIFYLILFLFLLFVLFATFANGSNITLRWDANTETDLAGYKLYYRADLSGEPYDGVGAIEGASPVDIPLVDLVDINNPEYTITELDATHIYFLVLTAYDDAGNESGYSNEVNTFYISFPQNDFYINSTNYTSFPVSGRGAAGYIVEIYSDGVLVGTTTTNIDGVWSANCDFTSINNGNVNIYAETTIIDTLTSNIVNGILDVEAPSPPNVPTGLVIDVISSSETHLEWDIINDANGYIVYRDNIIINNTEHAVYNDTGLTPLTTYEYEIASYYIIENPSNRSILVSVTTLNNTQIPSKSSPSNSNCFINTLL